MKAHISGVGGTAFGRHEGQDTLQLMARAANGAIGDAGVDRAEVDGLLVGYSTGMPHLMLASVLAEHLGLQPGYAHAVQMGGATGCGMVMLAQMLVASGQCRAVLVVGGENRLTGGRSREDVIQTLAQVGHPRYEVPYGTTIPGYYALLASQYMNRFGLSEEDLAEFAVLMRSHAAAHPDAQFRDVISVRDVLESRPIATPLKLLDCCPISDGSQAFLVTADGVGRAGPVIAGTGQAHVAQHLSMMTDITDMGAARSARQALDRSGLGVDDIGVIGIYDSFTITVTMLLEEIGFSARGQAAADARDGRYGPDGLGLNTHGGLLSYGHPGVAGGMAHLAEVVAQMRGEAGTRQMPARPETGFLHGDGGVLSAHVSLVLQQEE